MNWDEFKKYFPDSEILCRCDLGSKCKGPLHLKEDFAEKVLATRIELAEPMKVTSGIRCPYWNAKQNGSQGSFHMRAEALDIRSKGAAYNYRLITCAIKNGIYGIGVRGGAQSAGIVHLDNRIAKAPEIFGY